MKVFVRYCLLALVWTASAGRLTAAGLLINEVLFNPPGNDSPLEYLEFRGPPNTQVTSGTYFLAIAGDAAGNPGTIQNVFDLSELQIGGNGLLVLLPKANPYSPDTRANILSNTNSGSGWGTGTTGSVRHQGYNGIYELQNPSATYYLIRSANTPAPGADIDANNDGLPDGEMFAGWTILDSIGVLDADGVGDFAYGALNFRRNTLPGSGAGARGVVVPIGFTPAYLGRAGNTTGSTAQDWIAGDALSGTPPDLALGGAGSTYPAPMAGRPLNHIGAVNFGAAPIPGVLVGTEPGAPWVVEGQGREYSLALNTAPAGPVLVRVACPAGLEASLDGGATFARTQEVALSNTASQAVALRAVADNLLDVSPRWLWVTNTVITSSDPANYPVGTPVPLVKVGIIEKDLVLLNELKVNPPGTNDGPYEYIELKGPAGLWLTNLCMLAIEGNAGSGPGRVSWKSDLSGYRLGNNGLLVILATNAPYAVPTGTTVVFDGHMAESGGALGNGTTSFLLLATTTPVQPGDDLDRGNDGVLEGLPPDTWIVDSVAWSDGGNNDLAYGGAILQLPGVTPDAATRLPWNETPNSAAAWIYGDLEAAGGETLVYNSQLAGAGFPAGTVLSPGAVNDIAPMASGLAPLSGVIGDPYNPTLEFTVSDDRTPAELLTVTATSTRPEVVPNANLNITAGPGALRRVEIAPVGIGYAEIMLWISDGVQTGRVSVPYAASAPGRPGGVWHAGSSDASTALAVDDRYMLVGDDENQVLRIYDRQRSGLPLGQFDMTSFLDLPDRSSGLPREVDVEASTRLGNRLFWIGSLGHAATGDTRTNRTRVFATDLAGTGGSTTLTYVGRYDFLKLDLINWDIQNLHGKGANYFGLEASDAEGVPPKAPDGSGLAIEGLAMMPGNTEGAFIAFRAPIVPATNRTFALIVPVLNFASLTARGGPPGSAIFGSPIELDLYNRGIRSIEGNTNGYLIIGGPPGAGVGPYPQDFRLYTWSGSAADQPQQRAADLRQLNPEGIVEVPSPAWTSGTQVQLLSDGGATEYYGDGTAAKLLPVPNFKKFRSDWLALGEVVPPAPFIVSASIRDGGCAIRWRSLKGKTYQLQYSGDLRGGVWQDWGEKLVAAGPFAEQIVPGVEPAAFFRIALVL